MREGDSRSTINGFVGRERELAELVSACEAGANSDAHLFLIYGEPGIGKTRLADELASRVKAEGLQVLWGRCREGDGAPAYWPWIQVIRSFLGALDPDQRRNLAVESGIASDIIREVAQIIPDLRPAPDLLPAQSTVPPSVADKLEPNEARFRLFDAVTSFLKMGARARPMLIVLDDLHDADEASLALLRFVAHELKGTAILIIATYRDVEMRRSPNLSKFIAELGREARPIPVSGLSESEVTKFVEFRARQTPDEKLVAKLRSATNGNPLFVDGIVRVLIAERAIGSEAALDRPFKIPSGIREAIRARLDGLSPESNSILAAAAAIGNEFDFNLCQSVAGVSADEAQLLLDEASKAGIVLSLDHCRYRFSHALIREAVYSELDTNSRILIHGKIGNRLEEIHRENIDPHLAELAHHFREARLAEKAIDYSVRAGRDAVSVFAFTAAMAHLQAALALMERQGMDTLQRADLLHSLGQSAFQVDRAMSLKYGESAIALYEGLGRFDQAARVHILLGNIFHMRGEPLFNEALASEHLKRAESVIAKEPETVSAADLYSVIAANECHKLNVVETASAARRSLEISARLAKRSWPAMNAVSFYAWSLCMKGQLREGFAFFDRAFQTALQAKVTCFSGAWGAGLLSRWLGDPRGARGCYERELNRMKRDSSPLPFNLLSAWIDVARFDEGQLLGLEQKYGSENPAIRFWIGGEWEAIADLLDRQVQVGENTGDRTTGLVECVSAGLVNLFLGEYARAEALFRYGLDSKDRGPVVLQEMRARPWLARVYVAMNRLDDAAGQVARCHQIMADGEDWRGLVGSVARAEAAYQTARGNYEIADRLSESALAVHRRYHTAWEEADTLQCWGRALAAAGDRIRAAEKFDAAIENHRSRGVGPRFLEWLTADKMRALGQLTQTDLGGAKKPQQAASKVAAAFRREGEFWTISYDAATFRLKDAKGLRYLAYLLARPGQRIHVYDLIEAVEGSAANGKTTIHAESEDLEIVREIGGPSPIIDARARSEYRARLRDLQAELDEAQRMNDLGRSERLGTEVEMVVQELTGPSGLGGRVRAASVSAERARGLVGRNIRSVVEKIRREHPALGRHFAATIRTGYFCVYQVEPDNISWQL